MTSTEISVDTADIHNDLKGLVAIAIDLGWTARNYRQSRKQGVVLRRMHEGSSIEVTLPPTKSLKDGTVASLYARVRRFSDPTQVAIKAQITSQAKENDLSDEQRVAIMADALPAGRALAEGDTVLTVPNPTIVSEGPRMSRNGSGAKSGRFYESDAVIERRWSDGSSDFACAWGGCDFISPNHLTVSSHYARSNSHKLVPEPVIITGPSYRADDQRIARLAAQIEAAADLLEPGADARALAAKIIEMRDEAKGEDDISPRELTAEERLERILRLADGGRYMESLEENRDWQERVRLTEAHVADLEATLAERARVADEAIALSQQAIGQRDVARAEADAAIGKWNTLRELVAEA